MKRAEAIFIHHFLGFVVKEEVLRTWNFGDINWILLNFKLMDKKILNIILAANDVQ